MELGLVLDAHRAGRLERKRHVLDERSRKAGGERGFRLLLDLRGVVIGRRVRVVRPAPEGAVDAELVDESGDARQPGLVRLAVGPRAVLAEARPQARVGQPVKGAHLRGRVAGDSGPGSALVDHHDLEPLPAQQQGGEGAGDSRA